MSNILVGIVLSFVFVCSRMITYGVMANFNMDGKGMKRGLRKTNAYKVVICK